jgi:hypothetical protein
VPCFICAPASNRKGVDLTQSRGQFIEIAIRRDPATVEYVG